MTYPEEYNHENRSLRWQYSFIQVYQSFSVEVCSQATDSKLMDTENEFSLSTTIMFLQVLDLEI